MAPSKPQSFPGQVPKCLAVPSCESAALSGSQLGRKHRPGNGYGPRAAGERLIQSWKGALVVKPFNGPSPMIISPGLELANSEPL